MIAGVVSCFEGAEGGTYGLVYLAIAPLLLIGGSLAETPWGWAALIIFPLAILGKWWAASIRRVEESLPGTQKADPERPA